MSRDQSDINSQDIFMQFIRIIMVDYKVIVMDLSHKWWDKWFVVGDLTIDILLHDYNYFSMTSVYLLMEGDVTKKQFIVRKPRRNLQGFWSKCDVVGFIDDLGGLLSEVHKFCGNDIYCVTDQRVLGRDFEERQKIFAFFTSDSAEKTQQMEKFLNEHNFLFLMADDVPFTD